MISRTMNCIYTLVGYIKVDLSTSCYGAAAVMFVPYLGSKAAVKP